MMLTVILLTCAAGMNPHECTSLTAIESKPVEVSAMDCVFAEKIAMMAAAADPRNQSGKKVYYKLQCRDK